MRLKAYFCAIKKKKIVLYYFLMIEYTVRKKSANIDISINISS